MINTSRKGRCVIAARLEGGGTPRKPLPATTSLLKEWNVQNLINILKFLEKRKMLPKIEGEA